MDVSRWWSMSKRTALLTFTALAHQWLLWSGITWMLMVPTATPYVFYTAFVRNHCCHFFPVVHQDGEKALFSKGLQYFYGPLTDTGTFRRSKDYVSRETDAFIPFKHLPRMLQSLALAECIYTWFFESGSLTMHQVANHTVKVVKESEKNAETDTRLWSISTVKRCSLLNMRHVLPAYIKLQYPKNVRRLINVALLLWRRSEAFLLIQWML